MCDCCNHNEPGKEFSFFQALFLIAALAVGSLMLLIFFQAAALLQDVVASWRLQ